MQVDDVQQQPAATDACTVCTGYLVSFSLGNPDRIVACHERRMKRAGERGAHGCEVWRGRCEPLKAGQKVGDELMRVTIASDMSPNLDNSSMF